MESKLAQVILDARDSNGWHIIGAINYRYASGRRPGGVVAFVRDVAPFENARCGTAQFYVTESDETVFWGGRYDLGRQEALADLCDRGMAYENAG